MLKDCLVKQTCQINDVTCHQVDVYKMKVYCLHKK